MAVPVYVIDTSYLCELFDERLKAEEPDAESNAFRG